MDTTAPRPNQTFRAILIAGAVLVLGLWAWAWTPAIAAWTDLSDGGFSAFPGVMATFTLLPGGVFALFNALRGQPRDLNDARTALVVVAVLLGLYGSIELYGNYLEAQDAAIAAAA